MSIKKSVTHYKLVNAYDEIVRAQVEQYIEKDKDMCQCEKCFLDVCAIVFNGGYVNFVTTRKGELFTHITESARGNQVGMTVAIMEAIKRVKGSPMH